MKFIHIADVHLGAAPDINKPWGAERKKEILESFQNIITVCNQERADLLLIAGDLFHRQPMLRELKEVNYYFGKLTTAQVVLIAGNHDFIGARSCYPGFEWNQNVHMLLSDTPEKVELEGINTEVYGFSYHCRDITEPLYDTLKPEPNHKYHILLAHGGDERNIPINKKRLLDSGFDYMALGHIHKPETFGSRMAYSGSLEPLDKNETGERGYILGELDGEPGNTRASIHFISGSRRQYIRKKLLVSRETTNGMLYDQTAKLIHTYGEANIYSFCIEGIRDEAIHFDREALSRAGNVYEVEDRSVPDYDFEALYRENADNMIGMFIKKIKDSAQQDEVAQKALYYGLEALLGAKN